MNVIFEWLEPLPDIRQVSVSDLVSGAVPTEVFRDFAQSLQESDGIMDISIKATTASFHILSLHYSPVFFIRRYIIGY
jgi:hypothetical protein